MSNNEAKIVAESAVNIETIEGFEAHVAKIVEMQANVAKLNPRKALGYIVVLVEVEGADDANVAPGTAENEREACVSVEIGGSGEVRRGMMQALNETLSQSDDSAGEQENDLLAMLARAIKGKRAAD